MIVALIVTERLEMRRARNLVEDTVESWNFDLGAEFARFFDAMSKSRLHCPCFDLKDYMKERPSVKASVLEDFDTSWSVVSVL